VGAESDPVCYNGVLVTVFTAHVVFESCRIAVDVGPMERRDTEEAAEEQEMQLNRPDIAIYHVPAFFSWSVNSVQSTFMRSLRAIQSSACS
jgi:hypothetical protein